MEMNQRMTNTSKIETSENNSKHDSRHDHDHIEILFMIEKGNAGLGLSIHLTKYVTVFAVLSYKNFDPSESTYPTNHVPDKPCTHPMKMFPVNSIRFLIKNR